MTIKRLLWIIGAAISILVVNVAISFLYVAIYSYIIDPGHPEQYYQAYAQIAAPYSSIIAGMPLFFFVCRWVAAKWEPAFGVKAAVLIWLVYALIDVTVLAIAGFTLRLAILSLVSLVTKLGAAYLGGILASRRAYPNASQRSK